MKTRYFSCLQYNPLGQIVIGFDELLNCEPFLNGQWICQRTGHLRYPASCLTYTAGIYPFNFITGQKRYNVKLGWYKVRS